MPGAKSLNTELLTYRLTLQSWEVIMASDIRYIQFPLHLIDSIPEKLKEILAYGIVRYGSLFSVKRHDVFRQIVYLHYKNNLPYDIMIEIKSLINSKLFTDNSDYNGFDSEGDFDPDENIEELDYAWSENLPLCNQCVQVYQTHLAADSLGISISSYEHTLHYWKSINAQVEKFESKYGKDALTSISTDMAFDYRDNDKGYYEIELLKAFLAIKSLQGKAKLCETNKAAIIMRMAGSKSKDVLKEKSKTSINKRLIEKFNKRYHIDKLLTDLRICGFIQSKLPNNRSLFISTSLNDKELAKAAFELIKRKEQKTQKATIKKQENEAKSLLNQLLQNA